MEGKDEGHPSRQNTILRAHFRQQYMAFSGDGVYLNRTFMERYVDRQIDHLLEETEQRLGELEQLVEQSCLDWKKLASSFEDPSLRRALKSSLDDLEDAADSLGDRLGSIFRGLDTKGELPPIPEPSDVEAVSATMAFLKTELNFAGEGLRRYLFEPSHTVSVQILDGDDILVRLYRVKKIAEALEKKL